MDYIHELRKLTGPRKLILNCAGALIIKDDRILFQRRADNGKWGLIGGLLEMNETYEEAALREIREETGLIVKLDAFLGVYHNHNMVWSNGDCAHVISAYYTASIVSGEPRIDEESYELRFFGKNEIPDLFAEDHRAALAAYFGGVRYTHCYRRTREEYEEQAILPSIIERLTIKSQAQNQGIMRIGRRPVTSSSQMLRKDQRGRRRQHKITPSVPRNCSVAFACFCLSRVRCAGWIV